VLIRRRLPILLPLVLSALLALGFALAGCGEGDDDQVALEQARRQGAAAERRADEVRDLRREVAALRRQREPAAASSAAAPAPVTATADPRVPSSGTYWGAARQRGEPADRYDKDYPLEMTFSASGSYVRYPALACEGTLRPIGFDGNFRVYEESISSGHCDTGGTWHVLVEDSTQLSVTWARPAATYTVSAVLER
jgi:hypothetical protein